MEQRMIFQPVVIRGIPVKLNVSLLFIFFLLVVQFGFWGIPAGILLFVSILVHELGHAIVAQELGVPIARIDLHLLGGTATMVRPPGRSRDEILIAAAGPIVSLVLSFLLSSMAFLLGGEPSLAIQGLGDLLAYGAILNFCLGMFNLLPALPMDGGRIFRAALSYRFGHLRSTYIAARVSRIFGGIFVAVGLFSASITLALIGVVVFYLAGQEERFAEHKARTTQRTYTSRTRIPYTPFGPWSQRGAGFSRTQSSDHEVIDVGGGATNPPPKDEFIVGELGRWIRIYRR